MRSSRFLPVALLAIVLSALVGGVYGSVLARQDEVTQQYRVFTAALAAVDREYVDDVPSDRLVYGGIEGMLKTLDPHSNFFDPREYARMRERQEGRYYGLGIQIQPIDGDITVMSIFEGSPAFKKGLRRGDVIARIESKDATGKVTMLDAKGMSSEDAVKLLKGPKGTTVNISIRRRGYDQLLDLEVMRDEVNIVSVRGAFMLDGETGYIKLAEFIETSNHEIGNALEQLTAKGMKRLVLDLRDNPGGALDQAIAISNRFLPKGDMIVYTRGRVQNSDQDYRATEQSDYTHLPIVVLVSRNSASASEIVSGALQDHDRALIVGETTFGKALVQSVYRVGGGENAGLALTTGRYYTPSGRLIQRPWDSSFDEYVTYTYREQKAERPHNSADLKYTDAGRKVYSGGGIEPDKFMSGPVEGFSPGKFARQIWARGSFANYADQYMAEGDTRFSAANKNKKRISKGFTITDEMLQEFRTVLQGQKIVIDEEGFKSDLHFIKAMMHYEIDLALFGVEEARRNLVQQDPQARFAVSQFGEAQRLTEMARATPRNSGRDRK
jgi:carboxyl-terminal processing protease